MTDIFSKKTGFRPFLNQNKQKKFLLPLKKFFSKKNAIRLNVLGARGITNARRVFRYGESGGGKPVFYH